MSFSRPVVQVGNCFLEVRDMPKAIQRVSGGAKNRFQSGFKDAFLPESPQTCSDGASPRPTSQSHGTAFSCVFSFVCIFAALKPSEDQS